MTAKELLEYQLNQAGRQLDVCLEGMSEAAYDTKCSPIGMTPRDLIEHLCEAYVAIVTITGGGQHEWGSFTVADKSTANLSSTYKDLRSKAVHAALAAEEDAAIKSGYDYIVGHDCYHVGQLVLARLQAEPEWDSYAIYS